ncbi:MAG: hypothetical protein V1875_02370 [Candidatus Altiarchaeota archaeon]
MKYGRYAHLPQARHLTTSLRFLGSSLRREFDNVKYDRHPRQYRSLKTGGRRRLKRRHILFASLTLEDAEPGSPPDAKDSAWARSNMTRSSAISLCSPLSLERPMDYL